MNQPPVLVIQLKGYERKDCPKGLCPAFQRGDVWGCHIGHQPSRGSPDMVRACYLSWVDVHMQLWTSSCRTLQALRVPASAHGLQPWGVKDVQTYENLMQLRKSFGFHTARVPTWEQTSMILCLILGRSLKWCAPVVAGNVPPKHPTICLRVLLVLICQPGCCLCPFDYYFIYS